MNRELLKAHMQRMQSDHEEEEEEEELDSFPATMSKPLSSTKRAGRATKDYSPISAAGYFSEALQVDLPSTSSSRSLRVYYTPIDLTTPSSSSSTTFSTALPTPAEAPWIKSTQGGEEGEESNKGVLFICVHGAGYSGLSFAVFAKEVRGKGKGRTGVLSYDARGHGRTPPSSDDTDPIDLSLEALTSDLVTLLKTMFPTREEAPKFLLVGHSMGGAVVVEACPRIQASVGEVVGLVVLDVVEGSALEALEGMNSLIAGQPTGFESIEKGIEWHLRTKTINDITSARISVPPLLVDRGESYVPIELRYGWRVDLAKSERYWKGWFTGLSNKFLACRTAKLLVLAGADRLDKELMIGQMQGKFQLEVFRDVGHCLQEDAPERTAITLLEFWARNDRTDVLRGVKKVGQK